MNATVALMTTEMSESFSDVMVMVHAAQWGSLISILVSFCLFEGNGSEGGGGGGGGVAALAASDTRTWTPGNSERQLLLMSM